MTSRITRRDLLRLAGGSALGFILSPLPWKLLDDTAIWTQNWPWIPEPSRGDVAWTFSTCTLCPAACGLRVRRVGGYPQFLSSVAEHPMSGGTICPTGLVGHHLPFHPARALTPMHADGNGAASPAETSQLMGEIAARVRSARTRGEVVFIDSRPGRAMSGLLRRAADILPAGMYIESPAPTLPRMDLLLPHVAGSVPALGFDLRHASCILSFGAPLVEGWGSAEMMSMLLPDQPSRPTLLQCESVRSRTANLADLRLTARPGTETLVALAMARTMFDRGLVRRDILSAATDAKPLATILRSVDVSLASDRSGIPVATIEEATKTFASKRPSVAVAAPAAGNDLQNAVTLLNILNGSVGAEGGVRALPEIPGAKKPVHSLENIPDGSAQVILLDESMGEVSIDPEMLQKKLAPGRGIVVSLSPFLAPRPGCDQYVLPACAWGESLAEAAGIDSGCRRSYALSGALTSPREGAMDTFGMVRALAQTLNQQLMNEGSVEEVLKNHVAAIVGSKRGSVFTPGVAGMKPLKELSGPDDLWSTLTSGGCWVDNPPPAKPLRPETLATAGVRQAVERAIKAPANESSSTRLTLVANVDPLLRQQGAASPLMSKLREESGLYASPEGVRVNPATARARGLNDGDRAELSSGPASRRVLIGIDGGVPADTVLADTKLVRDLARVSSADAADVPMFVNLLKA